MLGLCNSSTAPLSNAITAIGHPITEIFSVMQNLGELALLTKGTEAVWRGGRRNTANFNYLMFTLNDEIS